MGPATLLLGWILTAGSPVELRYKQASFTELGDPVFVDGHARRVGFIITPDKVREVEQWFGKNVGIADTRETADTDEMTLTQAILVLASTSHSKPTVVIRRVGGRTLIFQVWTYESHPPMPAWRRPKDALICWWGLASEPEQQIRFCLFEGSSEAARSHLNDQPEAAGLAPEIRLSSIADGLILAQQRITHWTPPPPKPVVDLKGKRSVSELFPARQVGGELQVRTADEFLEMAFSPDGVAALRRGGTVEAFIVHSNSSFDRRQKPAADAPTVGGYPILSGPVIVPAAAAQRLASAILDREHDDYAKNKLCGPLMPAVAFRISTERPEKKLVLLFCFGCMDMERVIERYGNTLEGFKVVPQGFHDEENIGRSIIDFRTSARDIISISRELFPDDQTLKDIEARKFTEQ